MTTNFKNLSVLFLFLFSTITQINAQFDCGSDITFGTGVMELSFASEIDCKELDLYQNIRITVEDVDYDYAVEVCGISGGTPFLEFIPVMNAVPPSSEVDNIVTINFLDANTEAEFDDGSNISLPSLNGD